MRRLVRELSMSNMQNCQYPVSMSESVTLISARDASASENIKLLQPTNRSISHQRVLKRVFFSHFSLSGLTCVGRPGDPDWRCSLLPLPALASCLQQKSLHGTHSSKQHYMVHSLQASRHANNEININLLNFESESDILPKKREKFNFHEFPVGVH